MGNFTPEEIIYVQSVPYVEGGHGRQCLDLLVPAKPASDLLPVIVFIHGGAYRSGDKEKGLPLLSTFVASGRYTAASINYRYSSDAIWPAQIHDCKAAIRWIRANSGKYGIDGDKIAVWGASAGGHLAAMLGTSCGIKDMEGDVGNYCEIPGRVSCVVDFFGPMDLFKMDKFGADIDYEIDISPAVELFGGPIDDNRDKVVSANPIAYINGDEPPFLVIHGTDDAIVPYIQSELLHNALQAANVKSVMVTVKGGGHGNSFGKRPTDIVSEFFDHHLRGIETGWADMEFDAIKEG